MPILLTRKEAAKELSVSTKTIDRLITNGTFRPTRIGRAIRIARVQASIDTATPKEHLLTSYEYTPT